MKLNHQPCSRSVSEPPPKLEAFTWGCSLSVTAAENDLPNFVVISGGNQSVLKNQHIICHDVA